MLSACTNHVAKGKNRTTGILILYIEIMHAIKNHIRRIFLAGAEDIFSIGRGQLFLKNSTSLRNVTIFAAYRSYFPFVSFILTVLRPHVPKDHR